ncbi:MarR family transcriptional regulator [Sphingobium lignivorans]|uniref:DNA-binding MarR family transcriptional regulator n=1 Tax=Sphingobium lignivorans TaxID=2735886 RepID=A0ABR6NHE9_9SPHN|nr:DNA-binding MarR family transcriptional regulator [Sphingobium lignivorans]
MALTTGTVPTGGDNAANAGGRARRDLLYARLITLMQLADESARMAYPRQLDMPDIHRQLIFMLGMHGGMVSRDLATTSGRGKAQISRGIKGLQEAGMIERHGHRSAIGLNARGQAVFSDVMAIARARDRQLCEGLPPPRVARFIEMTEMLVDRASSIFVADEAGTEIDLAQRSLAHHLPGRKPGRIDNDAGDADAPPFRDMVLPWLQSLITYMRRSGTVIFRREVGLSNFEWRVLSLIEENQPINLSTLIARTRRDKSQIARMIKQLHQAGLVDRQDEGRINTCLALTAAGRRRYEQIYAISLERDRLLFAGHPPEARALYLDVMDHLTANAQRMLKDEQVAGDPARDRTPAPAPPGTSPPAPLPSRAQELQTLRDENVRLKRLLAEAMLENAALRERLPKV